MALSYYDITRYIESTVEDFSSEIQKSGNYAWRLADAQIKKMDINYPTQSDSPHIIQSDKNRAIINAVGSNLVNTFMTSSFQDRILSVGTDLEVIEESLITYYENNFGDLTSEAIRKANGVMSAAQDSVLNLASQQNLYDQIFSPAIDTMYEQMYQGVTMNEFTNNAQRRVQDRFDNYFTPMVSSILQSAFAHVNDIFGTSFKLVWVSYQRRTTTPPKRRDFCDAHESGKNGNAFFYHIDEVRSEWANFEGGKWSGAFPNTNGNNILVNRGGYGCLHAFDFHRADEVNAKDKARAKRKGYI